MLPRVWRWWSWRLLAEYVYVYDSQVSAGFIYLCLGNIDSEVDTVMCKVGSIEALPCRFTEILSVEIYAEVV